MIKIGTFVMVLDDNIAGYVNKIEGNLITITTADDFDMTFDKSELVVKNDKITKQDFSKINSEVISQKTEIKQLKSKRIKPKDRVLPVMEIDLHIHHLVKSERGLDAHDMLNIQINEAQRKLEFAIQKKIQRLVFIHGIGNGRLRAELEFMFQRYANVTYEDANLQKYGRGATAVYIYQNPKQ